MRNRSVAQAKIQELSSSEIFLLSTRLNSNEAANLAYTSKAFFWRMTGIDLDNSEHRQALTTLSEQLTITAPPTKFSWFQSIITKTTLTEFIIGIQRNEMSLIARAKKIATEDNQIDRKSMHAQFFMEESAKLIFLFSFLAFAFNLIMKDLYPLQMSINAILLFYGTLSLLDTLPNLKKIFIKFPDYAKSGAVLELENTITPAVNQLMRLSITNPLTGAGVIPPLENETQTPTISNRRR